MTMKYSNDIIGNRTRGLRPWGDVLINNAKRK